MATKAHDPLPPPFHACRHQPLGVVLVIRRVLIGTALLLSALWLNNTSAFIDISDFETRIIAHRGIHQIYAGTDRTAETCTANPIHPPSHSYIANTLPSIKAALAAGADVVEIDVHLTTDDVFAVFHDWTVDCQTNGTGVTHEHSFKELQTLDLGYGYTADGTTFPLRGTGIGAMPKLETLLAEGLGPKLLINFKSNRAKEGRRLATRHPDLAKRIFGVYGGRAPTQSAIAMAPGTRGFDKPQLKACLIRYILLGWSGHVPAPCRNTFVAVPMDYAPYLWGWPHRLTTRLEASGSSLILWGPYDASGFSSGIDSPETLARVPPQLDAYLWTNRIERIGPLLHP